MIHGIESKLSAIRMMNHLKRMSFFDVMMDSNDPLLDGSHSYVNSFIRDLKDDSSLPAEIRRILNQPYMEPQIASKPITDA